MRRNAIQHLMEIRLINHPRPAVQIVPTTEAYPERELDFNGNVFNQKARDFYQKHGVQKMASAAESGLNLSGKKIMTTRYCIKYELGMCPRQEPHTPAPGQWMLVDEEGVLFPLKFDCSLCQMEVYFKIID